MPDSKLLASSDWSETGRSARRRSQARILASDQRQNPQSAS
jgi:hypothetical protein